MCTRREFAFVLVLLFLVPASAEERKSAAVAKHGIPREFIPVDTRKLLTPPDPLPLEAARAFPKLTFDRPVELTHAGDGRVFVVEQRGVIKVFANREDTETADIFLDLRDDVLRKGNEEGLLGLAFHPRYQDNGEFFVYYSAPEPRRSIISRFRVSKSKVNQADRKSEEKLLEIEQPYENHNGGSMKFGPDGFLYIGLGDGGLRDDPHSNGQNLETLLGSILRIDVDHRDQDLKYAIPKDNPFVDRPGARGEIWAYGFRNPWRIAFDSETKELWTGDVGQDRFEEVNLVRRGGNYGWNIREGFHPFNPNTPAKSAELIDPLAVYFRDEGQSVTGGIPYRGDGLEEYRGAYFYGDFLSGKIWALRRDNLGRVDNRVVAETGLQIAAFGETQDREMYVCAFDGGIYRLRSRKINREAARAFPRTLSATGLFFSVADNEPAPGLIPYELNMPFWSDYAVKDRYLALPGKGTVTFDEQKKWKFPVGAVFVKTFWMHRDRAALEDPVRLETRLLVRSPEGWAGYTYRYNEEGTDAELLDGSLLRPVTIHTKEGEFDQPYYFPSRTDCMACHTKAEGFVLGPTTRQMNRVLKYRGREENQIDMFVRLGIFEAKPESAAKEREEFPDWGFGNLDRSGDGSRASSLEPPEGNRETLARAWLEVNCAVCHRPEGIAPRDRDLRFHTPLESTKLVDEKSEHGSLGGPKNPLLNPHAPRSSELLLRLGKRGDGQMPPLGTRLVDERGYEVVRKWIESLKDKE